MLPSHTVRRISSKASLSSVSEVGLKVISTVSNAASSVIGDVPEVDKEKGVSIVAACMNRQETLEKVLPTWLAVNGVKEIVIVDWGSDPPLRPIVKPERDPRLQLYRVKDESSWVLSRAYNLALNKSTKEHVIRTDCDYSLHPDILNAHNLSNVNAGFYSGNWELARNENEVHLNGAMVMKRDMFWDVGGYDERIQTYGWDDEDLYTRLQASKLEKLNISYDHVNHVSHGDGKRAQSGVKFAQVQIDLNQLLLEKLPQWSPSFLNANDSTQYEIVSEDGSGYHELKATHVPKPLRYLVDPEVYEEAWAIALGRRLADDFQVPWDVLESADCENKEKLLRKLMTLQEDLDRERMESQSKGNETTQALPSKARLLIVHCMHGLGNRLRAIGSALAFAKNAKRVPVIIWESDAHIAAEFDALFNISDIVLLNRFIPKWPFKDLHQYDSSWKEFKFYNYMEMEEGANKGELIKNDPSKHLYYKGAYIMEAPDYSWWEADNEQLRNLKPVGMVQDKLSDLEQKDLSNCIGVHIRNRTLEKDIKNVDFNQEYGSEAASTMEHWRTMSSYKTFVTEMERILQEEDKDAKFYVATDTFEILAIMSERFPGKILRTERKCDDRDSECVKYAVVDMYALSKTKKLLGSNWSSYTEMAERLGGLKARLAGQDFGAAPNSQEKTISEEAENRRSEEELVAEEKDRMLDSGRE
ncbi:Galactosyltransferase [Gracilaria domingensis]|nr:Galactosyltransferase [Gracilaria domingensis]